MGDGKSDNRSWIPSAMRNTAAVVRTDLKKITVPLLGSLAFVSSHSDDKSDRTPWQT